MNFTRCIVPIQRQIDAKRFEQFGSGVLLKIAKRYLLVSAAHVILNDRLWIFGEPENTELNNVEFITTAPDLAGVKDDVADIGFGYLPEAVAQHLLANNFEFLPVDQTSYNFRKSTNRAAFSGFPCTKSKLRISAGEMILQPVFIEGELLSIKKLEEAGYDPDVHLATRYRRKEQFNAQTKERINGVDPYGMSGGPVWRFSESHEPWLAGIGTDYDSSQEMLKGTRFEAVLGLIQQQSVDEFIRSRSGTVETIIIDLPSKKPKR